LRLVELRANDPKTLSKSTSNKMSLRIGAVSYLNTKPLIYGLPDQLASDDLDIALIPSAEYFRGLPVWSIVSDACIACHGAVRSVRLLFRCSPANVRTLALDEGSRTSAALAQVLLHDQFGVRPKLQPLPIAADFQACDADAILIIGDRAMQVNTDRYLEAWDLGEKWCQWTGLPFVFAMWVAKDSGDDWNREMASRALESARDAGLAAVQQITLEQAPKYQLSTDDCLKYFTQQLHFRLGPRERQGLELFRQRADQLGLLASHTSFAAASFKD
jgi:chorismate dehydratase